MNRFTVGRKRTGLLTSVIVALSVAASVSAVELASPASASRGCGVTGGVQDLRRVVSGRRRR